MESENAETVRRIYDGWERGDFTVGVPAFEPDVVLVIDPEIPDGGTYQGLEGIRSYTTHFLSAWESITITPETFEEAGDRVLVRVRQDGVGRESGALVGFSYFQLWTCRGRRVVRLESILHEARAREAFGAAGGDPRPE